MLTEYPAATPCATLKVKVQFAVTKRDELVLAEANKTGYKELGRVNPGLKMGIPQQPTLFNGRLYLRGNNTVVCYQVAAFSAAK